MHISLIEPIFTIVANASPQAHPLVRQFVARHAGSGKATMPFIRDMLATDTAGWMRGYPGQLDAGQTTELLRDAQRPVALSPLLLIPPDEAEPSEFALFR
jgi:hypothetical protein